MPRPGEGLRVGDEVRRGHVDEAPFAFDAMRVAEDGARVVGSFGSELVERREKSCVVGAFVHEVGPHDEIEAVGVRASNRLEVIGVAPDLGRKRVRNSQLSRLISRPVSTRFGSFLDG